jgi:hypothetical protein
MNAVKRCRTISWSITPDDTFDVDYGKLLDRVCGKKVASLTGCVTVWKPRLCENFGRREVVFN